MRQRGPAVDSFKNEVNTGLGGKASLSIDANGKASLSSVQGTLTQQLSFIRYI